MLGMLVLAAASLGDVQPFVEKNTTVLVVERGNLNGDAREDAVLVLEPDDPDQPRQRRRRAPRTPEIGTQRDLPLHGFSAAFATGDRFLTERVLAAAPVRCGSW